ncbi:MAG: hypothetical protein EON54_03695 [Alcaligenaceae bacterium]|nr:MAG: hypothetical protein EON54_03695 [Alcaligenaceae bacterium]
MRRLLAAFLLVLLPFQLSWSAVATYCLHESSAAQSQHVGHHEHKHEAMSETGEAEKSSQEAGAYDFDCSVCHGSGIGALSWSDIDRVTSHGDHVESRSSKRIVAVVPLPPDRPQWSARA